MASLLLIRGLPGSGKSFIARQLLQSFGASHSVIIDPDLIDKSSKDYTDLCESLAEEGVEDIYFPHRYLRAQAAEALLENKIAIWNQAFTLEGGFIRTIEFLTDALKQRGKNLSVLVVEVEVDPLIAKSRIKQRVASGGHDVPDERFEKFQKEYVSFAHLGYPTITVDGAANPEDTVSLIRKSMKDL